MNIQAQSLDIQALLQGYREQRFTPWDIVETVLVERESTAGLSG